jgi:hypothetical protein
MITLKKIYESRTITTWIIVGMVLVIVLITSPQWKIVYTKSNTYWPYECAWGSVSLVAEEWKHRTSGVENIILKIFRNGSIITTEDFDEDNIGFTKKIPNTWKCIPLVIRTKKEEIEILWACLEKIHTSNQLRSDIVSKKGMIFEVCSISEYVTDHNH